MPRFRASWARPWSGSDSCGRSDVFRLLSQQVRERVMELFSWTEGEFSFFRGLRTLWPRSARA